MPTSITIDDLARLLETEESPALLDVRPLAAYNGWALTGEPRSGHLTGAVPFPGSWLEAMSDEEIRA